MQDPFIIGFIMLNVYAMNKLARYRVYIQL